MFSFPNVVATVIVAQSVVLIFFFIKLFINRTVKKNDEVGELKTEVARQDERLGNVENWVGSVSATAKETSKTCSENTKNLAVLIEIVKIRTEEKSHGNIWPS
jgi:hypothetical protein